MNVLKKCISSLRYRLAHHPFVVGPRYRKHFNWLRKFSKQCDDPKLKNDEYWAARFRLLAHALDKGLHSVPVHQARGRDVYTLSRQAMSQLSGAAFENDPSLQWCKERVEFYQRLQETGVGLAEKCFDNEGRNEAKQGIADLAGIIQGRRSVRNYQNRLVRAEDIRTMAEMAQWAPCSCNRQTLKIYVSNRPELAKKCHETCRGKSCFGDFVPCFATFCIDVRPYQLPDEYGIMFVDAGLGAQNFALAAHVLGISPTFMAWGMQSDDDEAALRRLFGIQPYEMICVNCALGYPSIKVETPLRKPPEQCCRLVS